MSKSRLGISSFDLNIRFKDRDEAFRYAKRLREFIRYTCKNKAKDGWSAEAMICISNIKGNCCFIRYEHNGKKGRPRIIREYSNYDLKYYNGNLNVDWHIHIFLVSKPMYAFRDVIKQYIDRNWKDKIIKVEFDYGKLENKRKVYKKNTNVRKAEYFINQADEILFCNYNFTGEERIPKGYSLKDLYYAYLKRRTGLRYHLEIGEKKKQELEENYYKIFNFYWNMTKEDNKKMEQEFMKRVQKQKIIEEYERRERRNKVQSIFEYDYSSL